MHILLVHQAFAALGEPGGTRHHELARYLAQEGARVTVLAGGVSYLTGTEPTVDRVTVDDLGVRIHRPAAYGGWHKSFFHRFLSFVTFMITSFFAGLRIGPVDVVWGTSPPLFQGITAWLLARGKRARFLFEVRDLWPLFAVEVGVLRSRPLIALSRWLEQFLYQRADALIVNSPGFVEHVRDRGGRSVQVVPNGVDATMFDPADSGRAVRREHQLDEDFVILYAGAHGLSNDLGVALEAAKHAPEATFVFVGDGKEKGKLQQQAAQWGLENVRFLPPVPKKEMPRILAAADGCLAILKPLEAYKTTYPNKVFDYMAAGRPVLLAIDGVIRQVVEEAAAGLFVPPGDPQALAEAVETLRRNPDKAAAMGRSGRQYVMAHYDRPKQARELQRILERMLTAECNGDEA